MALGGDSQRFPAPDPQFCVAWAIHCGDPVWEGLVKPCCICITAVSRRHCGADIVDGAFGHGGGHGGAMATPSSHVVGDVIANTAVLKAAPKLQVTPGLIQTRHPDQRLGTNMWQTGARICEVFGATAPSPEKLHMVAALDCISSFHDGGDTVWQGRTLIMEVNGLVGSTSRLYIEAESSRHGTFCEEWVPYMELTKIRLYTPDGMVVNPNTRYRALCAAGVLVKDVVHWSWMGGGGIKVTALPKIVTNGLRRQITHFMRLMVLNFPQLLHPGSHDGRVRYTVRATDHVHIGRVLTEERRLHKLDENLETAMEGTPITTHGDLVQVMQQAVGAARILEADPHPRMSRMVCLRAGSHRLTTTRRHFKRMISARSRQIGRRLRDTASPKWARHSPAAAHGLDLLPWKTIRRVVGLTPWGAQLLLRVKHHALSVFDPISAGLHCPHTTCASVGRVSLHHVFWTCPAASRLRPMLVDRWKAAGLWLESYESAIFALSLQEVPAAITAATGRIIADCLGETIGGVGDMVERMAEQCWSLNAALYLHSVWRWRVAFFDPHNDTSNEHHEGGYVAKLRRGNTDIVRAFTFNCKDSLPHRIGRVICEILGSNRTGPHDSAVAAVNSQVLFYTGSVDKASGKGYSGIMVAHVNAVTRRYRVLYICGAAYAGHMDGGFRPTHLALLKGLRDCRKYGWRSVHAVGDNTVVTSQHRSRKPPRAAALKMAYWTARRTADAVGVVGWSSHPREHNTTARAALRVAQESQHGMEWTVSEGQQQADRWATTMVLAEADVLFRISEMEEARQTGDTVSTV